MPVSQIAAELGISYQFAYNVAAKAGLLRSAPKAPSIVKPMKPPLTVPLLLAGGFEQTGEWLLSPAGALTISTPPPRMPGVYAFVQDKEARYVGVTLRTLFERMNLYRHGHSSQPTNVVMRARLIEELSAAKPVSIYTVQPPDGEWNGWPITTSAGLEIALIRRYRLPWNKKGI